MLKAHQKLLEVLVAPDAQFLGEEVHNFENNRLNPLVGIWDIIDFGIQEFGHQGLHGTVVVAGATEVWQLREELQHLLVSLEVVHGEVLDDLLEDVDSFLGLKHEEEYILEYLTVSACLVLLNDDGETVLQFVLVPVLVGLSQSEVPVLVAQ